MVNGGSGLAAGLVTLFTVDVLEAGAAGLEVVVCAIRAADRKNNTGRMRFKTSIRLLSMMEDLVEV